MKSKRDNEIYIHVPFCARKCSYCDFVSFAMNEDMHKKYFDALIKEIDLKAESVGKIPVGSCFIGGGTPSLVNEKYILSVLEAIDLRFSLNKASEITIEMNPNSASLEKIKAYKQAGINRVSIGLQSTIDSELRDLGRLHSFEDFLRTYEDVRNAGFENVNIDLMSAIPGQTIKSYEKTLRRVLELKPEHISAYSLIIEEGTPFYERYKEGTGLPSEEDERNMYYMTKDILASEGYLRYEISNYAKKGYECKHNIGYWERVPYLGFGIASSSLWGEKRFTHHSDIKKYIEGDYSGEETDLDLNDRMEEFMFLGLRLTNGVLVSEFKEQFGKSLEEEYGAVLCKLQREGLLVLDERVRLTDKGLDVANYCMSEFIH